jgi:bacterioferritin-associated ferredoxin
VYVCLCLAISDRVIRGAIVDGARTLEELEDVSGAGSVCGGCYAELQRLLDEGADEDGEGVASTARAR